MAENKNLENVENTNPVENTESTENQPTPEKKKTAADLILQKLQDRQINEGEKTKVEELRKIEQEVKTTATPDTVDESEEISEEENNDLPNFNEYTREELVDIFNKMLTQPIDEIIEKAELVKNTFYKKRNTEINERKLKFIEDGGDPKEFKADFDDTDNSFKASYDRFRELKQNRNEQIEAEQQRNLNLKNSIIDQIEELITKGETLNKTFDEFHKLREDWNNVGTVPQAEAKNLLEKYNFTLQKFYDWVKINKELRDLDLKRNLDLKIKLCEEAESLIIEPKIVKAYQKLQKLHDRWKEIGPIANEHKEEVWNRFKETSSIVNKKHYEYFQEIKHQQVDNLKAKELLCEEAEKIADSDCSKPKDYIEKTEEINELMKLWKLIGFAPKKYNNQIFERFIEARKKFFDKKQQYYQNYSEVLDKNLQLKEEIIVEADNAKDNTNWKQTTDLFIDLQKRWKKIGPVGNDKKDEIWEKFNEICNHFFDNKRNYFKNKKEEEENNLSQKKEIIEKIKAAVLNGTPEENLKKIQEFQKQWSEIGYVPFKSKDSVYKEYKEAIDAHFKNLNIDNDKRKDIENKNRIKSIINSDRAENKIRFEIEKVKNEISNLNSEIITLENNLSFFVKSKNSKGILDNLNKKLSNLKSKKEDQEKLLLSLTKAYKETLKDNK